MTATTDQGIHSAFSPCEGKDAPFHACNRKAVALWLFMAMWTFAVLLAVAMSFRSDTPLDAWQWMVLSVFVLAGVAGCVFACSLPIVSMHVDGQGIRIVERRPFSSRTTRCDLGDVSVPAIREDDVDAEGDPYFHCYLLLPRDRKVAVAGSHRRCEVQALRTRILVALATQGEVRK